MGSSVSLRSQCACFSAFTFLAFLVSGIASLNAQSPAAAAPQPLDQFRTENWCSLPNSSQEEFLHREQETSLKGNPNNSKHVARVRDEAALTELKSVQLAMEAGQLPTDAVITGQLKIASSSGSLSVPVTYEVTRDGKEKVVSQFAQGTNTFIADGKGHTAMRMGTRYVPLSPTTQDDHEIKVLPQWSRLARSSDQTFGVKSYQSTGGLDALEVLPPERPNSFIEGLLPRTATCVAIDPKTLTISRIETVDRAENRLTRTHRMSVVYSNYQRVSGIAVPMTQTRFRDGKQQDQLNIQSITFNNGLGAKEFTWQGN